MIEGNYLYIDKTKDIYNLITSGGPYDSLSRPRRFGKSLLISTLEELFLGNRELFQTGYLTVKEVTYSDVKPFYTLSYPNLEVKESFLQHLLSSYTTQGTAVLENKVLEAETRNIGEYLIKKLS